MSYYETKTPAQRKAWGRKMAAARAAKAAPARGVRASSGRVVSRTTAARRVPVRRVARKAQPKKLSGYGDYFTKTPRESRGIGERIGRSLGGGIGKGIQMLVKHITGFGDYNIQENSLMSGGVTPPQIVNSSAQGGIIVRHREYLGDINATVDFTLSPYTLNPGLQDTFPWLSSVAANFEQYKFRGVVFEFKSLSSDAVLSASTSSALGAVIMATEYNTLNDDFANKNEMENHEFSNSRKPSLSFYHPIECKQSLTPIDKLYVRSTTIPSGADARLYDLGRTQIATVGMQATSGVAGELWVTYEVELYKPCLNSSNIPESDEMKFDHFKISTGIDNTHPLGTVDVAAQSGSNLGGTLTVASHKYTFPADAAGENYLVIYSISGSSATLAVPSLAIGGGTLYSFLNVLTGTGVTDIPATGATMTKYCKLATFSVASAATTYTLGTGGTLPSSSVNVDLFIIKLAPGLTEMFSQLTPEDEDEEDISLDESTEIPLAIMKLLEKKGLKLSEK